MLRKAIGVTVTTLLFAATLAAQAKPNFSGTWKLNTSKSDFGMLPPTESRTDVIDQADPALKVSTTSEGAQGKQSATLSYTTDGKEVTNKVGPREIKSTAAWEGDGLVVNSKFSFNDAEISMKNTWTLAADGKTMTQSIHFTSPMGETDQKLLFEKQTGDSAVTTARASSPAAAASANGSKTNYSGTWKLNVAKSDFGVLPGPETRTDIIDHKDPILKVSTSQDGPQGKQDFTLNLTTDGKEAVNTPGGLELKSIAGWEAANLVVNTKLKFQDNDVAVKTVWVLSEDGKTLTQNAHLASAMGELDQKLIFEKQ